MFTSGLVPRRMAMLGLIGGPLDHPLGDGGHLRRDRAGLHRGRFIATIPEFIWELSLGLYLVIKGFEPAAVIARGCRTRRVVDVGVSCPGPAPPPDPEAQIRPDRGPGIVRLRGRLAPMTYVIAEPCIDVKDRACVDECPVDCIYEGPRMLYIQPDECIDCGACEPVCPVTAIFYRGRHPRRVEAVHGDQRRVLRRHRLGTRDTGRRRPGRGRDRRSSDGGRLGDLLGAPRPGSG